MPWSHCDQSVMDTDRCPTCGLAKSEWTIQFEKTRTFQVGPKTGRKKRDAWIEVQLVDGAGAPLAGAAYRIGLPSGRIKKGELDGEGKARLEEIPAGTCQVSFPGKLPDPEERETGELHVFTLPARARYLFSY